MESKEETREEREEEGGCTGDDMNRERRINQGVNGMLQRNALNNVINIVNE